MKFELLPNEILIECFEYLNAFDLFHSFDRLNDRFNKLIRNMKLHLNFQDVNKSTFDEICTKILQNPDMKSQVYSLKLSDKYQCRLIQTFLSLFSLDEFSNLRSLTIVEIDWPTAQKVRLMLPLLPQLYHLDWDGSDIFVRNRLVDSLLTKLRTLTIHSVYSLMPSNHETVSIINLTIFHCYLHTLYEIIHHTSMLKYLNIQHLAASEDEEIDAHVGDQCALRLRQLIIHNFCCSFEDLEIFVKRTPNLTSLTIGAPNNRSMVDAHRWKHLITSSLRYLNIFKFRFGYSTFQPNTMGEKFKEFQTNFWHEQHHWYTEYEEGECTGFIYTLPYISNTYEIKSNRIRYCNNLVNNVNTFENVTNLIVDYQALSTRFQCYFPKITALQLTCYEFSAHVLTTKHIQCLKRIVNLFNLKHVRMSGGRDENGSSSVLLEILKEAPQLSSMTINSRLLESFLDDDELCKYLNRMIKRLNVTNYTSIYTSLKKNFYETFSNIEHLQCETFSVDDWLFALNQLPKLSTLKTSLAYTSDHESKLAEFIDNVRKLNVIVHTTLSLNKFGDEIFMWSGKNMT